MWEGGGGGRWVINEEREVAMEDRAGCGVCVCACGRGGKGKGRGRGKGCEGGEESAWLCGGSMWMITGDEGGVRMKA